MFFLREFCEVSSVLKVISFVSQLLNIVRILVPIGLIIMVSVDLGKNVISGKEEDIKKNVIVAIKRIAMAVVIFFIPSIILFVNGLLDDFGADYTACLEYINSDFDYIGSFEKEEEAERIEADRNRLSNNIEDISSTSPYAPGGGINTLPEDEKYYPLRGKDMDGNDTVYLEIDGKYLTKAEMDDLDQYIKQSVKSVGNDWGLRVAAAGYSLVFGLQEYGLRLHYQKEGWGTDQSISHAVGVTEQCSQTGGFCVNWGRRITSYYINKIRNDYGYTNEYAGVDCTGFVNWALRTGCGVGFFGAVSGTVGNTHKDLSKAKPGDVMLGPGHVQLVVKNNGDGTIIVAESTSGYGKIGLVFSKVTSIGSYVVNNLDDAYKEVCVETIY